MFGKMILVDDDGQLEDSDFDIPLVGVAAQKSFYGTLFKCGLEVGGLFNWQSEVRSYAISSGDSGGTAAVALDINAFLLDYFFGAYSSFEPANWVRLYLGAGPLLTYGSRKIESINPQTDEKETTSDSGFGVGVYTRLGLELIFTDKVIFGVGVRGTKTGLNLKDKTGDINIAGWQYVGGLSFRF